MSVSPFSTPGLLTLPLAALLAAGLTLGVGCTAASVTAPIDGEPVCADFQLGGQRSMMKGSLRKPVKVTVLVDDDVRSERIVLGRRKADDPPSKVVVRDHNETYTVRWAQCPNVFAPKRVAVSGNKQPTSYDCGEAKVYKEHKLEVRDGDPASRVIAWAAPPEPDCWSTSVPAAASASASASAEPPAPEPEPPAPEPSAAPSGEPSAGTSAAPGAPASAAPSATASAAASKSD